VSIVFNFVLCLIITIVVEGILILLWYARWDYAYYSILCNIITNPMLNLLLYLLIWGLGSKFYIPALVMLEIIVVFVEAYIYKILCNFTKKEAFKLSLVLNISSYLIGLIIRKI